MSRKRVLIVLVLLIVVSSIAVWYSAGSPETAFAREPSPDGRYDIVREIRSTFLDGYERLWITARGEEDRKQWFPIAPEVDGYWFTDWPSPTYLVLTDHGAWPEVRMPYHDATWRDVRIETRPAPKFRTVDSPDELHRLDVWTFEDSRGT